MVVTGDTAGCANRSEAKIDSLTSFPIPRSNACGIPHHPPATVAALCERRTLPLVDRDGWTGAKRRARWVA